MSSSSAWDRLGQVIRATGQRPWMTTHTQMPHAELIEGSIFRVYFTCRDGQNRSHIGWLVLDLDRPDEVLDLALDPLMAPGLIGRYDDMGVMTSWMTLHQGRRLFYVIGWNVKNRVPMHTSIGLASGPAEGPPVIDDRLAGPVFERNPRNPYYVSCPCVLVDEDGWRMWYMSGLEWAERNGAPVSRYTVWHARSPDGIAWSPDPDATLKLEHPGELAIARPCVVRDPGVWRMWHCYRGEGFDYRIGYAESVDGQAWTRRDDDPLVLLPSGGGFDSQATCYPYVFDHGGERWMFYCGDGFGQAGMGLARLRRPA